MLLTISYTGQPTTDLGYLLHKGPFCVNSFAQVFGKTHAFYPESTSQRCTVALALDVDSIGPVRNRALDEKFPTWGERTYFMVTLKGTIQLSDLLTDLYVLIPVLDDDKHYRAGDAEVEKLLRHAAGWLRDHPERELITNRYLKHQKRQAPEALSRLIGIETEGLYLPVNTVNS